MTSPRAGRAWFEQPSPELARALLGRTLVCVSPEGVTSGRIVETEAYLGIDDAASHAALYRSGREAMSRPAGAVYMYRAYGVHAMFNIVSDREQVHGAVLIRAIEPLAGIELMRVRRGSVPDLRLTSGPGNLCVAMGLTLADDGRDLVTDESVWIELGGAEVAPAVSLRIGITRNTDAPLRFYDPVSPFVSAHRRSVSDAN
ncbi:MAG: DNA-3-methyladenine glycosylase [Thermomicrobiales bacterium]|nr:DNA-3-methyladenine glycosylase [Thermomicrobiales bacterium]